MFCLLIVIYFLSTNIYRIENKDIFVDLCRNENGAYIKLSERSEKMRNMVLFPVSGLKKLQAVLDEVVAVVQSSEKRYRTIFSSFDCLWLFCYVYNL